MKFLPHDPTRHGKLSLTKKGVFENIPDDELQELRECGEWAWNNEGEVILEVDQEQPFLYVVIQGKVQVYKTHFRSGREQPLADLHEGECFGEMSFLGEGKATANVKTVERTLLWRLSHENLMEYLQDYKGAGQICLNLAAIMAHRLKEGNTRLAGLAGGLSAYFGLKSRMKQEAMEAPVAGDHAEMEIPDRVMESFTRETLRLQPNEPITPEQTDLVQEMLDNEKVDLVRWLESGASGNRLKLKLRFVQLDKDGEEIQDEISRTGGSTVQVGQAPTEPSAQKPKAKPSLGPRKKGRTAARGIPSRAGKKGTPRKRTQPVELEEEKEPTLLKKVLFPIACVFLCFLLTLIVILVIPGATKANWVRSEDGKEVNGFMRSILFPTSKLPFGKAKKDWTVPFQWPLSKVATEKGWMDLHLQLKKPLKENTRLKVYISGPGSMKNLLTKGKNSNVVWELEKGQKHFELFSTYIEAGAGTDYRLELDLMQNDNGEQFEGARVKAHIFR